jgi:hypothetical protein
MKTAMQELIDDLRELKKHSKDNKQDTSFDIGMTFAIARAELRLEKEKEQIMNAFSRGLGTELSDWEDSQQYYDRIYNQNK